MDTTGLLRRLFLASVLLAPAPVTAWDVSVGPSVLVPVGETSRVFGAGLSLDFGLGWPLAGTPLTLSSALDAAWLPTRSGVAGWAPTAVVGLAALWPAFGGDLGLRLGGGGTWAFREDLGVSALLPYGDGEAQMVWPLVPTLRVRIASGYAVWLGLAQFLRFSVALEVTPEGL